MVVRSLVVAVGGYPLGVPAVAGECVICECCGDFAVFGETVFVEEEWFGGVGDEFGGFDVVDGYIWCHFEGV